MEIHKSITFKIFAILAVLMTIFVSAVIYVQLFVVSRSYLTTDYMKRRQDELSISLEKFEEQYMTIDNRISDNLKKNAFVMDEIENYESQNESYLLIFDKNYNIKYADDNTKEHIGKLRINSIRYQLINDIADGKRNLNFRVKGLLGIPSKYIAISRWTDDYNGRGVYVVAVTAEVYTTQNEEVLKKYVVYMFLGALIFIFIISWIISYIITRPVLKISKVASKMIEMDFKEKCDVKSDDEIGNLAGSLNFLSEKLDVTLKKLKSANEKLKSDLDMQKELDDLRKEFIAAVSHEFKTPITLIRGYTESIRDDVVRQDEKDMVISTIIGEVNKMDRLVQELLDLSNMEAPGYKLNLCRFYIDKLLEKVSKKYELIMHDNGIIFDTRIDEKDAEISGDSFRIEQVITNFLNNAIVNTEKGKHIVLDAYKKDKSIYVSVENEGKHIEDKELKRIWEKFYRVDKSRSKKSGGTGLGLSICRAILENHSYKYGVENTKCGVKFYFYIPL